MKILSQVALEDEEIKRLKAVRPDITVVAAQKMEDGLKEAVDADIFFGRIPREIFVAAKQLLWVQVFGAGVESCLFPEFLESDVILTSTSGAFNCIMADHAFALLLSISRNMAFFMKKQSEKVWDRGKPLHQLSGQTLGIIGLGNIGCEIARRGKAFGMRVIASDAKDMECPLFVDQLWGVQDMGKVLEQSDYLIVVVPLTPNTRGMIGAAELGKMKPTAHFINIGRGAVVDQAALIESLKNGTIAGAGLDVFEKEPLPPDSELWDMENVVITPHIGGPSPDSRALSFEVFLDNLKKFIAGEPMRSVIDKSCGY